jgi:hypothetical protein
MGVEYAHYLLVRDAGRFGDIEVARRVHAVLAKWQLVGGEPELFSLKGGQEQKLKGRLTTLKRPPTNLLVRYPHVDGGPAVAEVIGPSFYQEADDEWRYFQHISTIVGTDFRIGPNSDALYIQVTRPPTLDGDDIASYPDGSCLWEFDDSYPADRSTFIPVTRIESRGQIPVGFTGVWRAGVMLDCGKDLPRFDQHGFGVRVHEQFRTDLEAAFGTQLVEVGRVY